ncbi:MAG: hypothetical protein IJO99_05240 [Ruminococcus sp.]|nr:hypothetical protein [Ruminococcus sp.]
MEETKKPKKKIALKIFIVIISLWVLLIGVDFVRFTASNSYIEPLVCIYSTGCRCYEWREKTGLGYSFDYTFYDEMKLSNKEPETASFKLFGIELYTREN